MQRCNTQFLHKIVNKALMFANIVNFCINIFTFRGINVSYFISFCSKHFSLSWLLRKFQCCNSEVQNSEVSPCFKKWDYVLQKHSYLPINTPTHSVHRHITPRSISTRRQHTEVCVCNKVLTPFFWCSVYTTSLGVSKTINMTFDRKYTVKPYK